MDAFERYIRNFEYASIPAMKIGAAELLQQMKKGTVEVIDVRFTEEYALWRVDIIRNIPLNRLPDRLGEIDKSKTVVAVCPHETRSNIVAHYLISRGFKAKFLVGGLTELQQQLLGGAAEEFYHTAVKK